MEKRTRTKREWLRLALQIVLTAACVLAVAFIFSNSLKTGEESSEQSSSIVDLHPQSALSRNRGWRCGARAVFRRNTAGLYGGQSGGLAGYSRGYRRRDLRLAVCVCLRAVVRVAVCETSQKKERGNCPEGVLIWRKKISNSPY